MVESSVLLPGQSRQPGGAQEIYADLLVELPRAHGSGKVVSCGSATDDQRPRFAFDASELVHQGGVPEALELRRGDEIVFSTVQHADGGAPPRAKLQVLCWAG